MKPMAAWLKRNGLRQTRGRFRQDCRGSAGEARYEQSGKQILVSFTPAHIRPPARTGALACLCAAISLAFSCLAASSQSRSGRPFNNGSELARLLVKQATEQGGVADLSSFGQKTCVVPEGVIYPPSHAERLLPGLSVDYLETYQTDGHWFFLIGSVDQRKTWIFAIPQGVLRWRTSEDVAVDSLARCISQLRILPSHPTPTIELN